MFLLRAADSPCSAWARVRTHTSAPSLSTWTAWWVSSGASGSTSSRRETSCAARRIHSTPGPAKCSRWAHNTFYITRSVTWGTNMVKIPILKLYPVFSNSIRSLFVLFETVTNCLITFCFAVARFLTNWILLSRILNQSETPTASVYLLMYGQFLDHWGSCERVFGIPFHQVV